MTTSGARPRCPECGALLRRGREAGQRCDPCQRTGPRIALPESFYDQVGLDAALAGFDFGTVFQHVRAAKHWSQQTLAEFLGWEQRRISAIETGKRALRDIGTVVTMANQLAIPAGKLGFTHGITVGGGTSTGRKGSWVDRRDFVEHVAGLTLVSAATGLDIDRLTALLPDAEPTGTRHVGAADVDAIEQATAALRRQDFTHGSGRARDAAVTQLRVTLPLLDAQITPEVRPRLFLATADLATQAGWMSYDGHQHDSARRLWMIALDLARASEHPQDSDLTVYLLADMALQAVHLGRPQEALRLAHLGHTAAISPHPVSASTTSLLANIQARTLAIQGDAAGCDRALGQALDHFAAIDPATAPPWTAYLGHTGISGHQGSASYMLALHGRDPHAAARAVPLLRQAVDGFGSGYARLRALYLPDLAGAFALTGDVDTAITVGHQAIDAVTVLHSAQPYDRLRVLDTALQPLHTSAGVAELRDRLNAAAA
ncbi:MAG: helix-turn-helix domain-containing protein [Pseudonocardiaceae bacterium]